MSTEDAGFWKKWDTVVRHPGFATLITLLIIVSGLWGSVFSAEIRNAFPFYMVKWPWWKQHWSWSWAALSFWTLALISSLAFFFRERSVTIEQERVQNRALSRAHEFEHLIRTMPPSNFLAVFSKFFGAACNVVDAAFQDPGPAPKDRSIVEQSARHLLRMIATLAQEFDGDNPDVEYAANVMLFVPSENISSPEKEFVERNLLFCDESLSVDHLHGALQLELALSTTAADNFAGPDPAMRPIALPIPKKTKIGDKYKVLPGAPIAFADRAPDLYTDATLLPDWCRKHGDFTREVIDSVEEFFRGSPVRSFISIPLFPIADDGGDDTTFEPFAILNIHSSRPGLLKERGEPLAHFIHTIHPFQVFLVRLLFALNSAPPPVNSGVPTESSGMGIA